MSVDLTAEHAESAEHLRISAISALSAVRNKADLPTNTEEGDHPSIGVTSTETRSIARVYFDR
jgi:hypothetical protein